MIEFKSQHSSIHVGYIENDKSPVIEVKKNQNQID